jgi:TonB-dependent receptor
MTAWNVDITLEWYTQSGGSVVGSLFYKDVKDFIIDDLILGTTVPGQPEDQLFNVTRPMNFSDGDVKGFEIGFYQPLDELVQALTGITLLANYTYVDSSFDEDVGSAGFGFPGTSKNNYNLAAIYENKWLSTRLSYVYRDEYFRELAGQGSQNTDARFTGGLETLDLNITVRPWGTLSFAFSALNMTNDKRRDHLGNEDHFLAYWDPGRFYSLTGSYRF